MAAIEGSRTSASERQALTRRRCVCSAQAMAEPGSSLDGGSGGVKPPSQRQAPSGYQELPGQFHDGLGGLRGTTFLFGGYPMVGDRSSGQQASGGPQHPPKGTPGVQSIATRDCTAGALHLLALRACTTVARARRGLPFARVSGE